MGTIFMNSKHSETSDISHILLLSLTDKINLKRSVKLSHLL